MKRWNWMTAGILALVCLLPEAAFAQPLRQLPGVRPFMAGQIAGQQPPNSRRRPAASSVGMESTDFYPKNGYPKQLGDFYESGTANASGAAGTAGAAGNTGNTGVQSAGSMGFQGNTGNQIGQNAGGTILGGLFGNGQGGGTSNFRGPGITGGGFSGMVPKGFGFGGSPDVRQEWNSPLRGVTGR